MATMANRVLELRVHGVSNTPPENLLGVTQEELTRVAGNEITGFYRLSSPEPDGPREAYSWGQLTSGVRATKDIARALWTLLLPFALANLALHARTGQGRVSAFLVRLFCLSLTATLAVAATGVGVNLVAWQCVDLACVGRIPGPWEFLATGFWNRPGPASVVGLAAPLGLLLLIYVAARRSYHYEAVLPSRGAQSRPTRDDWVSPLQDPDLWCGEHQVRGLARLHFASGIAVAAAIPLGAMLYLGRPWDGWAVIGWCGAITLSTAVGLSIWHLRHASITSRGHVRPKGAGRSRIALALSGFGFLLTVVYLLGVRGISSGRPVPGYDWVITALGIGQLLLILALAVIGWTQRNRDQAGHADRLAGVAWGGTGAAIFALFGWAVGISYAGGIIYWTTDRLNGGATDTGSPSIALPVPLVWAGAALWPVLTALLIAALVVWRRWSNARKPGAIAAEYGDTTPYGLRRARAVAGWRALHKTVEELALPTIGWLAVVVVALAAGTGGLVLTGFLVEKPVRWWEHVLKAAADSGSEMLALVPVGLVALGMLVYRSDVFRRFLGVVWDVGTFWPRSAHPLAPPPYAEAAVPQLQTRTAGLLEPTDPADRVPAIIFSGHSQGALLCLATLLQLPQQLRDRAWLVTHGCQLNRLYGRVFPTYLGPHCLMEISVFLGQWWTSFWRETDPLGYAVKGDNPRVRLSEMVVCDPNRLVPVDGEIEPPKIRNHSDYPAASEYKTEIQRIRNLLEGTKPALGSLCDGSR
jgi:hypothetical protein